jgi:hypothetical protein
MSAISGTLLEREGTSVAGEEWQEGATGKVV